LASAYDFKQKGDDVTVLFQGVGTRWVGELSKSDHAAHALLKKCGTESLEFPADALMYVAPTRARRRTASI
jgi:hypothetical protein